MPPSIRPFPPSASRPAVPGAPGERGVALLVVLVVLFIVAVLMVDVSLTAETARRSARNTSSEFLMQTAIDAHLQVVLAQLSYDLRANKFDSLDDRWARDEFKDVTVSEEYRDEREENRRRRREGEEVDDDAGGQIVGSTEDVSIEVRVEDEERKFNLNMLMDDDKTRREAARDRFVVLLDRYRHDTPLDLSAPQATMLRDRVVEYLERRPAEGSRGEMPVPRSGKWRMLTPDELLNVKGFEDPSRGWTAAILLFDAREPEEAARYAEDPEGEPPEVYPGLLRYVTLWSGGAWLGTPDGARWVPININTAEKPVLETLFYKNPDDMNLVDDILEWRQQEKEGSPSGEDDLAQHQVFETIDDLSKNVKSMDSSVLTRNGISAATITVTSQVFSIDLLADREGARRQVRYVVQRHAKGFQTLLREERADPRFDEETGEDEEEDL